MVDGLIALFNSLIEYFANMNMDSIKETYEMIVSNINFDTIKSTFEALAAVIQSIFGA